MIRFSFFALVLMTTPAAATEMTEAMTYAYDHNPSLKAAQARLRSIDTELPAAQGGWRPSADLLLDGGVARTFIDGDRTTGTPRSATLSISQPIWQGGETKSLTRRAEADIKAERARLIIAEQTVLLDAATAFLDVRRDRDILGLEHGNVQRLQQQLTGSQKRFDAGELTVTDVRQSQSRLAAAEADETTAHANLMASEAAFKRAVGQPAGELSPPNLTITLPPSLEEATAEASRNDPRIAAAHYGETAAHANVGVARAALRPDVSLKLNLTRSWDGTDFATGGERIDDTRLVGSIVVPLYRAGIDYARLAGAHENVTAAARELDEARNESEAQVAATWAGMFAAAGSMTARGEQVSASEAALKGVETENQVGTRSVLDVLDAQQESRNARVGAAQALCDFAVAQLQLLALTGRLTAANLKLPVTPYNPDAHYEEVDGAWVAGQ